MKSDFLKKKKRQKLLYDKTTPFPKGFMDAEGSIDDIQHSFEKTPNNIFAHF